MFFDDYLPVLLQLLPNFLCYVLVVFGVRARLVMMDTAIQLAFTVLIQKFLEPEVEILKSFLNKVDAFGFVIFIFAIDLSFGAFMLFGVALLRTLIGSLNVPIRRNLDSKSNQLLPESLVFSFELIDYPLLEDLVGLEILDLEVQTRVLVQVDQLVLIGRHFMVQ